MKISKICYLYLLLALIKQVEVACPNTDPCLPGNYKHLPNPDDRCATCSYTGAYDSNDNSAGIDGVCDLFAFDSSQWYRSNTSMTTYCPPHERCGSMHPVWLNGTIPGPSEGIQARKICSATSSIQCCGFAYTIHVKNCEEYFVFCTTDLPSTCRERYCFDPPSIQTTTVSTSTQTTTTKASLSTTKITSSTKMKETTSAQAPSVSFEATTSGGDQGMVDSSTASSTSDNSGALVGTAIPHTGGDGDMQNCNQSMYITITCFAVGGLSLLYVVVLVLCIKVVQSDGKGNSKFRLRTNKPKVGNNEVMYATLDEIGIGDGLFKRQEVLHNMYLSPRSNKMGISLPANPIPNTYEDSKSKKIYSRADSGGIRHGLTGSDKTSDTYLHPMTKC